MRSRRAPGGNHGRRAADTGRAVHHDRFDQLVELAPDGILIHDGERVVFANAAAVRLCGATRRSQVVGLPIDTFLAPPYLRAAEAELLASSDRVAMAVPIEDTLRRLDGSAVEVEVTAIGFMDSSRASVHVVVRDISDRLSAQQSAQKAEEQLHQAQKMEAVGALAGGVAHEVNNMMTVVLGFGEFLLQDGAVAPSRLDDVRQIMKAAERAASVTRQVLAFSRRAFYSPRVVELAGLVRGMEPLLRRLLGEGPRLVLETENAAHAWADPGQMQQILVNLALNGRDAMPGGGDLTICTEEGELQSERAVAGGMTMPPGRYACLSVRDTGIGMNRQTVARAFEPFFTTKPVGEGTGLGLAATFGIVRQNKGYISVKSTPGRGSVFAIYLPCPSDADFAERPDPPSGPEEVPHAGATVLVVEDEAAVRTIVARALEQSGYRVLQAPDGATALRLVERGGPPDLVISDVIMPEISGTVLARRLRERWPALPILFMSGYTIGDLRRHGEPDFAGNLIQKPFAPEALVARVAALLSRSDAASGTTE